MTLNVVEGISPRIKNAHYYKQAAATFASCLLSMTGGLTFGYTAVLLPELERDETYPYNKDYDSWIASISPMAMILGCLFAGPISDAIGRRRGQMLLTIPFIIGWLVIGFAKTNGMMLLGRFITGICTGMIRPVGNVFVSEVSDPKYRSLTLFCPGLGIHIGSFFSHCLSYFITRRIACLIFIVPCMLCFTTVFFLKESPIWLITKGKTELGIEAFKYYRGDDERAMNEMKSVLESAGNKETGSGIKDFFSVVLTKPFMKSIVTIFFVYVAVQLCGVNTISFYAQMIFKSTFGDSVDSYKLMLVTDAIRIGSASIIMFLLVRKLPRRKAFLCSCYITIPVLLGLVVYLCIKPKGLEWLSLTCLIIYIALASSLTSLTWGFDAELFPNKVRGFGAGMSSLMSFSLLFLSVKVTPDIMRVYGEAAMYGTFATVTFVAAVCLTFILPETGGKSLQEIENSMYNKNKVSDKTENDVKLSNLP